MKTDVHQRSLKLRAGELVEVRPVPEIMATLDASGSLDGLPFMPEMLQYAGKRFRVFKSAHKTCDTIHDFVIRRMDATVHLEGLRCDGSGHGECQAGCLLFWKEAWLKRVESEDAPGVAQRDPHLDISAKHAATVKAEASLRESAVQSTQPGAPEERRYRCQATELLKATSEVRRRDRWDPRFYLKDLTSGNVSVREFVSYGLFGIVNAFMLRWFGKRYPRLCGLARGTTPASDLNLQANEIVHVRSKEEIMQTVNAKLRNRGLSFDVEMVRYCETSQRVLRRVERIIDEKTGRLIRLPNPCIILDGVVCSGNLSSERMFCPRAVYPYWRDLWLKRTQ